LWLHAGEELAVANRIVSLPVNTVLREGRFSAARLVNGCCIHLASSRGCFLIRLYFLVLVHSWVLLCHPLAGMSRRKRTASRLCSAQYLRMMMTWWSERCLCRYGNWIMGKGSGPRFRCLLARSSIAKQADVRL